MWSGELKIKKVSSTYYILYNNNHENTDAYHLAVAYAIKSVFTFISNFCGPFTQSQTSWSGLVMSDAYLDFFS